MDLLRFLNTIVKLFTVTAILTLANAATNDSFPTLSVTNFGAFVSNTSIPSHISFHVQDPRPDNKFDADCIFSTTEKQPTLFIGGWWACDENSEVMWWFERDWIKLRRKWEDNSAPADPPTIGVTDRQNSQWSFGMRETGANATNTTGGTFYSRTTDWEFPITTVLV